PGELICNISEAYPRRGGMSESTEPAVTTESGIPVEALYSPATTPLDQGRIGDPGSFPFTRGNFPSGYRHKLWTFRQYSVFGTAAIMLAFYIAVGKNQPVPIEKLRGTIQNDILKEYVARGTWIWPPEPSIRLIVDTIEFCAQHVPRYNAISVAGAHFRDAGCTAAQEMAFTLADGVTYVDAVLERGRMTIDEFAPQVSFFFYTHSDFFEEIAKYRAGRRRWATLVKE